MKLSLPGRTLLGPDTRRAIGTAAELEQGVEDTSKGRQVLIISLRVLLLLHHLIIIILISIRR